MHYNVHDIMHTRAAANRTILSGPSLVSFKVDMDSREIVLLFDEPIDPDSVDVTGITISGVAGTTNASLYYQLTPASTFEVNSPDTVRIALSDADFDDLQSRLGVATMQSNTLLSMEPRTVTDRSNLHIMAQRISSTDAVQPLTYVSDTTQPDVTSFTLDLDSNTMALTFSEPVFVTPLFTHHLMISSHSDPTLEGIISYNLNSSGGEIILPIASRVINFTLSLADTTFLEMTSGIATDIGDTYLSASDRIAFDTVGLASSSFSSLSANEIIGDVSPPSVVLFGLDLNEGILNIHFDDPVNVSTFNPSSVTLQSAQAQRPMQWYTLNHESSSVYPNNAIFQVVRVMLSDTDLNEIKRIRSLCVNLHSCYMTTMASVARDINGLYSNSIPNGRGLIASNFTGDDTPPELVSWVLDMNRGQIDVTFSETVDITSFQPGLVSLQNSFQSLRNISLRFARFDRLFPADASSMFAIQLSVSDTNTIKGTINIGTSIENSYLAMSSGAIVDMNFNNLSDTHLQASDVIFDVTSPSLLEFSLNVYTGVLALTFDEIIINALSFNASGLTLANQQSASSERYTLTGGSIAYYNGTVVHLMLSQGDLTSINSIPNLATSPTTSYLVAAALTAVDTTHNQLSPISIDSALQIMYYVDSPIAISFEFPKYFFNEGRTVMLRVTLNATAATDVTFTVATEDNQALGMSTNFLSMHDFAVSPLH